jgi:hypothetical protein
VLTPKKHGSKGPHRINPGELYGKRESAHHHFDEAREAHIKALTAAQMKNHHELIGKMTGFHLEFSLVGLGA